MKEAQNILDLQRTFTGSTEEIKSMFEILCARIRYYQLVKTKKVVEKEVLELIHWVSDHMPSTPEYAYRYDVIKNQLWESINL